MSPPGDIASQNARLKRADAAERIELALRELPGPHVLSSSFGAQAAVTLHLVTRVMLDIPVVVIDTGYLFAETYEFIDRLTERLSLNLKVYASEISPAWHERRYGRQWEQGLEGLERYNQIRKVAPMQRALDDLGAKTWFAGLRRTQSRSRRAIEPLEWRHGRYKLHPIYEWTDHDVGQYLRRHDLPYHPLWERGYVSIGDRHSSRPLHEVSSAEESRFFGLKRECGLHQLEG